MATRTWAKRRQAPGWTSCAVLLCVALAPRQALGQASDSAAAVALFDAAEKLMAAGSYSAACPKYAESNRMDPQLGALVHLADCYEKNGQLASAWASWRDAIEVAQRRGDPREKIAKARVAALDGRLSKLVIEVPTDAEVPGLEIRRGGTLVSRALWGTLVPVDAGEHVIEASAPGKQPRRTTVAVRGEAREERYELAVLKDATTAAAAPSPTRDRPTPTADSDPGATQRTLGWAAGGLGVVGLGVGLVFELRRSSKASERADICPDNQCSSAEAKQIDSLNVAVRNAATVEAVSFVAGGVLLAGGAVLLLTAPASGSRSSRRVLVGPSVARDSLGISAAGRW